MLLALSVSLTMAVEDAQIVIDNNTNSSITMKDDSVDSFDSWWNTLDTTERSVLLASVGTFVLLLIAVPIRYCCLKRAVKQTTGRTIPKLGKDEFFVGKSLQNPMRAPEFKGILDILAEHGEFDDISQPKNVKLFVGIVNVPYDKSEHILGIKIGNLVRQLDQERDWLWGCCSGSEGWFDPRTVRELTKNEIKEIKKKQKQLRNHQNNPKTTTSAISEASISATSSISISALLKSPLTAEDALEWDATDIASPQPRNSSHITKPSKSDHAVDALVSKQSLETKELFNPAAQLRKAEDKVKQEKLRAVSEDCSDHRGATFKAQAVAKKATEQGTTAKTNAKGPPIDPAVAKNFYDMFN